jgi:hypothetical protein
MLVKELRSAIRKASSLHESLADSHPSLRRGQVWCRSCGATLKVDSAECLRSGWPKCCGETMTIDEPAEAAGGAP